MGGEKILERRCKEEHGNGEMRKRIEKIGNLKRGKWDSRKHEGWGRE